MTKEIKIVFAYFIILSIVLFGATKLLANEIYITQSGANLDLDITQDGENNQIEGLYGSGNAVVLLPYTMAYPLPDNPSI